MRSQQQWGQRRAQLEIDHTEPLAGVVNGRTAGRVFLFPRSPATHHLTVGKARGESTHALAASRAPVAAPTPFPQVSEPQTGELPEMS